MILCKAGGIACFLMSTWMLIEVRPSLQGYLFLVPMTIALYSLGAIGIFGARFGEFPYLTAGLMFIGSGVMLFIVFMWDFLSYRETSIFIAGFLPFMFMLAMLVVGVKIIERGDKLEAAKYLLTKWSIGVSLNRDEVWELLLTHYRNARKDPKLERPPYPVLDYLEVLMKQEHIQQEKSAVSKKERYRRVK